MVLQDDRTEEEKRTHPVLWVATDRFMSGWGAAEGGVSYAAWACRPEDSYQVERWIRGRGDMMRIRECLSTWTPDSRTRGHAHIYVVRDGHPSIGGAA